VAFSPFQKVDITCLLSAPVKNINVCDWFGTSQKVSVLVGCLHLNFPKSLWVGFELSEDVVTSMISFSEWRSHRTRSHEHRYTVQYFIQRCDAFTSWVWSKFQEFNKEAIKEVDCQWLAPPWRSYLSISWQHWSGCQSGHWIHSKEVKQTRCSIRSNTDRRNSLSSCLVYSLVFV